MKNATFQIAVLFLIWGPCYTFTTEAKDKSKKIRKKLQQRLSIQFPSPPFFVSTPFSPHFVPFCCFIFVKMLNLHDYYLPLALFVRFTMF